MKTPTKRATRRLAASLAIITALATSGAWAADVKWTGAENNNWGNTNNWQDKASDRPLPTNDKMIFESQYYNARFTENEVVFNGVYANGWSTHIRNVGTAEAPLVFRATAPENGLQFGNQKYDKNNDNKNNKFGCDTGNAYLSLVNGTWSTGQGRLYLGGSSTSCCLTLAGGASLSVGDDIFLYNAASKLNVSGGSVTGGRYFCLRAGEVTVENGTLKNIGNNFELGQDSAVTLTLNAGGVLEIMQITDKTYGGTVMFNGGEIKAASNALISDSNVIIVKVGTLGGAVNANSRNVTFDRPIAAEGANDGGMTFKGGGSVSLKYTNTYTGETKIAVRTKLVVTSAELARLLANGGIRVVKPEGVSAKGTYKLLGKSDGNCTAAEYESIRKGAGLDGATFAIDEDGDITVTVSHTPQTWAGAAETSATWSGNNWDEGVAFDDGNDAVFAMDGAIVEVDADYSAYTLTFNDNAALTGTGTLTVPTITVAEGKTASIDGPLAGAIEKTGTGTLTLGSTREGTATTLTEGTLVANAPVGTLVLGADALKPVIFDSGGQTYSTSFKHNNGCDVTLTNCTFSSFSGVANGTVHVAKGATAWISGWLITGPSSELTDTVAVLDICGGVVSNVTRNVSLGDHGELGATSVVRVRNGGLFATGNDIVVGARAAATLTVDDGCVIVPNDVLFCQYADCKVNENCFVNLNAGGLLTARSITYDKGLAAATFTFNGGTLKANQDYTLIANKPKMSVITDTCGTIDAGGHAVMIAKTISGEGGMAYQGGGKVTYSVQPAYTGVTTVEVGTTLVVPAAIAGDNLAFTVPGEIADGVYTVVSISGDSQFADDVLSGKAAGFVLSGDKKKICYVKNMDTTKPIYIGTDGNLSAAGNWFDGTVPTGGNGDAQIFCASASTLTVGDTFAPAKVIIPDGSALVTIGSGTLCVGEVVNRQLLVVGSGATVVIGDQLTLAKGESLCDQNNGTLVVSNLLLKAESGDRFVTEHQAASSSGIFKFDAVTNSMTDNWFYLADKSSAATYEFYIGAGGLNFKDASGSASYCLGHNRTGISTTIRPWYSDFTIADKGAGDYSLVLLKDVTFCTHDENGVGRTITIDAKTRARYSPKITVSGSGTLRVNNGNVNLEQPTVTVTGTATLAFGAGASLGTGAITLGAETKLVLTATSREFSPIANTLNLPTGENEVATIRIDGTHLKSGDHEIATVGNAATTDNVTLDMTSAALAGRRASLKVDEGKLLLNIKSAGTIFIVR